MTGTSRWRRRVSLVLAHTTTIVVTVTAAPGGSLTQRTLTAITEVSPIVRRSDAMPVENSVEGTVTGRVSY